MSNLRHMTTALIVVMSMVGFVHADCDRSSETPILLREFVNSKRTIPVVEKEEWLKIHGDIRAEWAHRTEELDGVRRRGHGALDSKGIPIPNDGFDAQFNLKFDYKCERSWAAVHLQMSNTWGIEQRGTTAAEVARDPEGAFGSGFCDDLCLKRAYMGINVWTCGKEKFNIEIGRRPLYTVFDSRIEFHARFDGILFRYLKPSPGIAEFYINAGPFVVDERSNHFAYVGEIGALNIFESHFDFKYSYIDWVKHGPNRAGVSHPRGWEFRVSQFTPAYNLDEKWLHRKARIYGAFLINTAAQGRPITFYKKANLGWYAGFIIGEVKKKGDWSFDTNYQYVEAQAIPDADVHGIGLGNSRKELFTTNGRGKANYQGYIVQGLYAITDQLSADASFEAAHTIDKRIAGFRKYTKFELDLIYAF